MTRPIIELDGISKSYQVGEYHGGGLIKVAGNLLRGVRPLVPKPGTHRALDDVSLSIEAGEVIGVIGPNGSGKSTLLKVLARITDPTSGRGVIRGRVAPLLEVGTGFHPEMTGRENVFINGTLLGMSRQEIQREFDSIVQFAGVESYIDTPVKRYSSGMRVRLGFAVAAHLQPEILLVDEILAVGDAEFQRRSVSKMKEVHRSGRTILFVSHQIALIRRLCQRAIRLHSGRLVDDGETADVIERYYGLLSDDSTQIRDLSADAATREGNGRIRFKSVWVRNARPDAVANVVEAGEPVEVHVEWFSTENGEVIAPNFFIWIENLEGEVITLLSTRLTGQTPSRVESAGKAICQLDDLNLVPGTYNIRAGLRVFNGEMADSVVSAATFEIIPGDYYGSGQAAKLRTLVQIKHSWHVC